MSANARCSVSRRFAGNAGPTSTVRNENGFDCVVIQHKEGFEPNVQHTPLSRAAP